MILWAALLCVIYFASICGNRQNEYENKGFSNDDMIKHFMFYLHRSIECFPRFYSKALSQKFVSYSNLSGAKISIGL